MLCSGATAVAMKWSALVIRTRVRVRSPNGRIASGRQRGGLDG